MTTKGYTAVGLAEVVAAAGVPKGSFYYYFKSKEEFGQALLDSYFSEYLSTVDEMLGGDGQALTRLRAYFGFWAEKQCTGLTDGKCLVVKLGPEVCDLSEDMRLVLERGTDAVIARIAKCLEQGQADGSITSRTPPLVLAESLYQLWLGASLLSKLSKGGAPFETAMSSMEQMLV
ncbi:HTH-type transcriptional repressor NemR [compost metagenome]